MHSVSDALLVLEELLALDVYHGRRTVDPDAVAALLLSCAASMQTDKLRLAYETLLGVRCYVCGTCIASIYGLTAERATEATAVNRSRVAAKPAYFLQLLGSCRLLTRSSTTCSRSPNSSLAQQACIATGPCQSCSDRCASSRVIPSHLLMTCTARDAVGRSWPPA